MDEIHLEELLFHACHGVEQIEKEEKQNFIITVILRTDLTKAGMYDDLESTIDYSLAYEEIRKIVEGPSHALIESLAWKIICQLHHVFSLEDVEVWIRKPKPPMESQQKSFLVHFKRTKEEITKALLP